MPVYNPNASCFQFRFPSCKRKHQDDVLEKTIITVYNEWYYQHLSTDPLVGTQHWHQHVCHLAAQYWSHASGHDTTFPPLLQLWINEMYITLPKGRNQCRVEGSNGVLAHRLYKINYSVSNSAGLCWKCSKCLVCVCVMQTLRKKTSPCKCE